MALTAAEQDELAQLEAEFKQPTPRGPLAIAAEPSALDKPEPRTKSGLTQGAQNYRLFPSLNTPPELFEQTIGGVRHFMDRAASGLQGAVQSGAEALGLPQSVQSAIRGSAISPTLLAQGRDFMKETGPGSDVGHGLGEAAVMGAAFGPIGKVAETAAGPVVKFLGNTPGAKLTGAIAKLGTQASGEGAANALINPEDRGSAFLTGVIAHGAGQALNKTIQGPLSGAISDEAKTLIANGVRGLTPGQLVKGENSNLLANALRSVEDSASSIQTAGIGQHIKNSQGRALRSYNDVEINKALEPLGKTVEGGGPSAILKAKEIVSDAYDKAIPTTWTTVQKLSKVIEEWQGNLVERFNLPQGVEREITQAVKTKLLKPFDDYVKLMEAKGQTTEVIPGKLLSDFDQELSLLRRLYKPESSVGGRAAGEVISELQDGFRGILQQAKNVGPDVPKYMDVVATRAKLEPYLQALEKSNSGVMTPGQLRTIANKSDGPAVTKLQRAARAVLPDTVHDMGVVPRQEVLHAMTPGAVAGPASTQDTSIPWLTSAVLGLAYSEFGKAALERGITPAMGKKLGSFLRTPEGQEAIRTAGKQASRIYSNQIFQEGE